MQTFVHGGENQLWKVVSFDDKWVFAKKLVDGKSGKGRPSKFSRAEVESLIEGGLVAEKQLELSVGEPVPTENVENSNSELVVTEESLELPVGTEVTYVNLD
jgi:hypothetical protein